MESLTEEELVQMVRDFIESESAPSPTSVSESLPLNHPPTRITLQEMIWRATDCEIELLEKILMYVRNMESDLVDSSNLKKGLVMKLQMDGYEASLCKTSWASTLGRPKGDYEYIDVMVMEKKNEEDGKQTRVIVDVDFRSQFEVARPTPTYEEIVANLPSIFVGTEEKLESVISLLCSAAKESMKERGLHIPPWRKASYMQSKWLSKDCNKVSFSPNNNNIGKI
ncbi:hypothetical protein FEM48_Zijuj06G0196400 [Ziziphus jujuba var. spinosa]|uniref:Uncharacterized protein n=1 Tax=Ziziphus jujuba var. spinosa TaxID=714518 RepID=A0A978VB84_ZIZJJ|nr:hypothetical protein FEM48_Zijuj06G0196400 [Ziziphus jujuba var. spinosa]